VYTPTESARVPVLDGIRGLAILLVMLHHQTLIDTERSALAVDRAFARVLDVGWCGVDLFFVLSGFLITGILCAAREQTHYFRNFYARRTLRIFPLYYAVVFLSLVILPNIPSGIVPAEKVASFGRIEGDEIWYWLYLSNFSIAAAGAWRHGILDISWSLAIEEQFYLLWPAAVWFLSREALMRLCVALFVGSFALRTGLVAAGVDPIAAYVLTPSRMEPLAAGAFIALASRSPGGLAPLLPASRRALAGCAIALLVLFAWRGGLPGMDPVVQTLGYATLAVLFASVLVLAVEARPGSVLARGLSHPTLRTLGKYSYALYLFHLPLRALIRDTVYGREDFPTLLGSLIPGQILFYALSSALALAAAWLSWQLFEKHFLSLQRFFRNLPPQPAPLIPEGVVAAGGGIAAPAHSSPAADTPPPHSTTTR
jgi:peptidoglycan/LPS O-acetylase OafA/YrhL